MLCKMPPPTNIHQIRQFIGLCNFFGNHIKDFSLISQPLHQLTRDIADHQGGTLPDNALKALFMIRDALISEPVVAFPRADRKFALVCKVKLPNILQEGCVSATLCQMDDKGSFHVLSHASGQFHRHEANYPPFLLDIANALYGMDSFDEYLRGLPFILFMDQHPQPELSHLHKKTYARLQAASLQYNFVIQGKNNSGQPMHLRSTSSVNINAMTSNNRHLLEAQKSGSDLQLIRQGIKQLR